MKQKYRTKQQAEIIEYLETVRGQHITAKGIVSGLRQRESNIGTATVYRQLDRLVDEGLMRKFVLGDGEAACFEYVGEESKCANDHCFHCMCTKCGQLIHVECSQLASISEHMLEDHGFTIDSLRTVFYGLCEDCRKSNNE